ncbi:MAG: helix-turn-helix domain-containing protein [Sediminibacterium sp.]
MQLTKDEIKKVIGYNIRLIRTAQKMTIETLAIKADMDYTQLSRIELGKINTSIYQLYKISKTLQVSIEELVKVID